MAKRIDFQTDPSRYRHWRVAYDGAVATLFMDVDENGGLFEGYQLKLNSYDLGVDIELADIVQRMRFEHPEVGAVVLRSGKDRVFCAGANIRMLGGATHAHKVNFCKFTNETRNALEAAGAESGQRYLCAVKGACAGGGYEIALACDHIILTDDGSSSVSLPEVPLLAVLPGTGGLTRVTDKRKVRRDLADVFCSTEEGVKGRRAEEWRLVDEVVANSKFEEAVAARAREFASRANPAAPGEGVALPPLQRVIGEDGSLRYSLVEVQIDRDKRLATITLAGPDSDAPASRRRAARGRRGDLDAAARARTRRRDPPSALQRADHRRHRLQVAGRRGEGARARKARRRPCGERLVRARDPALLEARAEARRPHLALARRADRKRLMLCGLPRGNAVRLRPHLHDAGRVRGRQSRRRRDHADERQFRPLSDVERSDAACDALSWRARQARRDRGPQGTRRSTRTRQASSAS